MNAMKSGRPFFLLRGDARQSGWDGRWRNIMRTVSGPLFAALVAIGFAMSATDQAQATLISQLSTDFSNTLNPDGLWSYYADNGTPGAGLHLLSHTNDNAMGYEGFGTLLGEPSIFKCAGIGNLCVFPSFYEGQYIRWTLPEASTVSIAATLVLVPPPRDPYPASTFSLTIAGIDIFSNGGNFTFAAPGTFSFISSTVFPAGTIVQMYDRSLACCGYFADLDITVTANDIGVPEPGTLSLFGAGLIAIWFIGWRRRNNRSA